MANKSIHDTVNDAQDKMHDAQGRVNELQHEAAERVSELREHAEETARNAAIDAQSKAQWQVTQALRRAERIPDIVYLGAVFTSMAASLLLLGKKRRGLSLFLGLWPVTILNLAMLLKNRRPSQEVTRIPSIVSVRDELLFTE